MRTTPHDLTSPYQLPRRYQSVDQCVIFCGATDAVVRTLAKACTTRKVEIKCQQGLSVSELKRICEIFSETLPAHIDIEIEACLSKETLCQFLKESRYIAFQRRLLLN